MEESYRDGAFWSVSLDLPPSPPGALQDPTIIFHSTTANVICSIILGKRFDYRDPEFVKLLDMFYQSFALISSFSSQVR